MIFPAGVLNQSNQKVKRLTKSETDAGIIPMIKFDTILILNTLSI